MPEVQGNLARDLTSNEGVSCSAGTFQGRKKNPNWGGVAQLGEHLPCKQGVSGSIPLISTKTERFKRGELEWNHLKWGLIAQPVRAHA